MERIMTRSSTTIAHRVTLLSLLLLLSGLAHAGRGLGEFGLLRPGRDGNLNWVPFHEVSEQAARTRKPVMIYFYEGEKSQDNAQAMINAQLRLFPEPSVKSACAGLICTKVDWTRPQEVEAAAAQAQRKEIRADNQRRKRRPRGAGDDEAPPDSEEEKEVEEETFDPFFLPREQWSKGVAIYFCDYLGNVLKRETRITTNERSFVTDVKRVKLANEKTIKAVDRAEEKEREKAEREARKQEEEEQQEPADGKEEEAPAGEDPEAPGH
jgi:hypothetical protein